MHRIRLVTLLAALAVPSFAAAEAPPPMPAPPMAGPPMAAPPMPAPPPPVMKRLGVGYKAGNGIGFLGGDVIVNVVPHVAIDAQASYFSLATSDGQTGTGYGLAPAVHGELYVGQRSTPYAAVGLQYASLTVGSATGTGAGGFVNLGYEWKWQSGLGIQLGGGVQYLSKIEATDGNTTLMTGGKVNPNLEIGLRYMFL
jgi:hypothetical protein